MTVKIATLADRFPEFVEYQHYSIKKYVKGDNEYIVFNNANDDSIRDKINNTCKNLGVNVIDFRIPDYKKHGSIIQGNSMNTIWKQYFLNETDSLFWIDADMFFISEIDIEKETKGYDLGYTPIYREKDSDKFAVECMWVGILFFDFSTTSKDIDFSLGRIDGILTDTGGMTYHYLKNHPDYKKLYFYVDCILNIEGEKLRTISNNCRDIDFINEIPEKEYCTTKLFPHEKEDTDYIEKYRLRYDIHKEIIEEYSFPRPYFFDLIRTDTNNKYFLIHFKSASWSDMYGNGYNDYAARKKEAVRKIIFKE